MKVLNWIAWISGCIGVIFVVLGILQLVFGRFYNSTEIINYFLASDSFFLLTIALFVFLYRCQCKKE